MTKEQYEQEMLLHLDENLLRYPKMGSADIVKFIFQGMLGVGHLLADRAAVIACIEKEMSGLSADPDEPLTEPVSPAWCRLNLRSAMAKKITAGQIADLMLSGEVVPFTRQDVYDLCRRVAADGHYTLIREDLERITDPEWLPSHSAAYRSCYRPAYRVIPLQAADL